MAAIKQSLAQMGTEKAGTAGDQYSVTNIRHGCGGYRNDRHEAP